MAEVRAGAGVGTASVGGTSGTGPATESVSGTGPATGAAAVPVGAVLAGPAPVTAGELGARLGIELVSAEPGRVVGSMPVRGNTQPFGVLHGGASCVLAESLASIGACLHFGADGDVGVGTEISASHLRPVSTGRVTGVATAVRLGRTQATYEIAIEDEQGRRVCSARMTCVRSRA